jgi:transcriptional regulator of acetoin/glycerol metabolism
VVTAAVHEKLGASAALVVGGADARLLASAGKPWRERSHAAAQALASGQPVPADARQQPQEAAEPIRCGGELIGAIACRWVAGTTSPAGSVAIVLRAAAMAIGTHVRAVLEAFEDVPATTAWGDLIGGSTQASALRDAIHRAARAPFPVLIEGESGSGKELVARAIHRLSARHVRRFCAINCAALTDDLVEAELFGHARGAFTGAAAERVGLFEGRTAARCSSTRSASSPRARRPSCCVWCRRERCGAWARTCLVESTCES